MRIYREIDLYISVCCCCTPCTKKPV